MSYMCCCYYSYSFRNLKKKLLLFKYTYISKDYTCIAELIPQSLQLQVRAPLASLVWFNKSGECVKLCACSSGFPAIGAVKMPVYVSLRTSCNHETQVRGPYGLRDSHWRLSCKITGKFVEVVLLYIETTDSLRYNLQRRSLQRDRAVVHLITRNVLIIITICGDNFNTR